MLFFESIIGYKIKRTVVISNITSLIIIIMIFQQQKYLLVSPFTCLVSIIFILRKSSCQETAHSSYHGNIQSCLNRSLFLVQKKHFSGSVLELVHSTDKRYFYFHLCIGIYSQRFIVVKCDANDKLSQKEKEQTRIVRKKTQFL